MRKNNFINDMKVRVEKAAKKCSPALSSLRKAIRKALNWLAHFLRKHWRFVSILIVIYLIFSAVLSTIERCSTQREANKEITIENTPIQIEDVRPKGEIYLCTFVIEDYTTEQRTERHLGLFLEQHSCVQILRQKVSYKIDLDKIKYTPDTLNIMIVELPEVEYVATTQKSPFMSDDEEYWKEELPNTNALKRRVAQQIKQRFDTFENRKKAESYAQEAISELLRQLGYEARFVPKLTKDKE